jgi:hypothetical protein
MAFSGDDGGYNVGDKKNGKPKSEVKKGRLEKEVETKNKTYPRRQQRDEEEPKQRAARFQPKHAIILNNMLAMRNFAFNKAYGQEVSDRSIAVMDMLVHAENLLGVPPNAMELIDRVCETLEVVIPTARVAIQRCVDLDMISFEWVDGRKEYFMSPAQAAKLKGAMKYLAVIPEVVMLQIADPTNPTAGSHLLPDDIYHNVICRYSKGGEK